MRSDFTVPLSAVRHVHDGKFFDTDGSVVALPPHVCADLDDDCTLEAFEDQSRRLGCYRWNISRGQCPFVAD
jgi:hypothetical protein